MIPEPDSIDKIMYYDYMSNNTDDRTYTTRNSWRWEEYTLSTFDFQCFTMNRNEGPKEEEGSMNKK